MIKDRLELLLEEVAELGGLTAKCAGELLDHPDFLDQFRQIAREEVVAWHELGGSALGIKHGKPVRRAVRATAAASAAHLSERGGDMAGEQYGQEPEAVDFAGDTVRAAEAMSDDELDQAIEALGARERRCLVSGKVEDAKSIAYDKWVCISIRARRGQRRTGE